MYDKLNRLSVGFYQKDTNPSAREYYEKVSYDLNGNIMTLKRSAEAQGTSAFNIDELTYVYENNNRSNRLLSVTDSSTDYRGYPDTSGNIIPYDDNGNMLSHNDKGLMSIDYNFLNLPSYITYKQGLSTRQGIIRNNTSYLYRSDGVKVRKIYRFAPYNPLGTATALSTEQTDYLDSFQYKTGLFKSPGPKGGSGNMVTTLEFYPTAEGYFDFVKNKYIYNYADHLGNVRLSYFHNGSSIEVIEENNYYPFGMKHEGYNPTAGNPAYQYKYNGKELQTESGIYDYGARFYMPDIGRWGVVDPLAETSRRWSTYNYVYNNPIRFIDPDGRTGKDWVHNRESNSVYWNPNATSQATAGANETYLGTSGTYTTENGSTTALNSDGSHTNNSLMGGLGVMNNLDPLIQAGDSAPLLSMATFGTAGNGSYIRETPSLNTAEGAFANPASQLASTTFTAMQQAPLAVAPELLLAKYLRSGSVIIGNGGNYVSSMNVVREIYKGEKIADLVSSLQARTLSTGVEHAIVKLGPNSAAPGARVIVSGGPHGISFAPGEVSTIFGHTHPFVTGPSAADFQALKILNQSRQYIVEGFNPPIMIRKP